MVTVVDRCEGSGPLSDMPVDDYLDHVHAENGAVWVTVSPYGLTGPRRRWRGTELTIAAAGGLLSAVTDGRTGWPIKLAGNQALLSAGQVAALATCHGIDEYTRTGNTRPHRRFRAGGRRRHRPVAAREQPPAQQCR